MLDGFAAPDDLLKATIDVTNSMAEMQGDTETIDEITIRIREIATDVVALDTVNSVNAERLEQGGVHEQEERRCASRQLKGSLSARAKGVPAVGRIDRGGDPLYGVFSIHSRKRQDG
jgi:hypothetical protein